MNTKWEDLLVRNNGNVLEAAQEHYLQTGRIHPDIPVDDIKELVDATPDNSQFGRELRKTQLASL